MGEFMPVMPEKKENKLEAVDKDNRVFRTELENKFAENQKEIKSFRDGYYFDGEDAVVIDDEYIKNFSQEEHLKKATEIFQKRTKKYELLFEEGRHMLIQLADLYDKEAYKFVLGKMKKNRRIFLDYPEECLGILKKGDIPEVLKDITNYISSGKIKKSEYFMYSYILTELVPEIKSGDDREELEKIVQKTEGANSEIFMLSMMLKSAKAAGEKIDFEMIKNLKLEKREIGDKDENNEGIKLSEEEKEEMLKMVEKNYREVVFKDNTEAAEAVIGEFRDELYGPENFHGQILYTLKFQNQMAGMVRFNPNKEGLQEGEIYAASFNVHREVMNTCIGKYLTNAALPEMLKKYKRIKAITRADNPMATRKDPDKPSLYETQGFAIDRGRPFEKYREKYYNMVMEKKL